MVGSKYACRPHLAVPFKCLDMLLTNFHFFSFLQQILFTTKFFLFSEEVPYQAKSLGYYTKYLLKKIVALALCLVLALSLCATAFATLNVFDATAFSAATAEKTYEDVYVKANTKGATTPSTSTDLDYYKAVAPKFDDDGYTKNAGHIEFFSDGTKFYVTSTKGDADWVVYTDAACENKIADNKVVYLKELASINDVAIYGKGTAAPKFGTDCGLLDEDKLDTDETYYVLNGDVFQKVDDAVEGLLKVGNDYVPVEKVGTLNANVVEHKFVVTSKDGKVTGVSCSKCNRTATKVGGAAAIPDGTQDFNIYADGTTYWVFAGASGTSTSNKVDSAKTFDAGIALYVGMSISAVAGSAVVIGKKKEF